MEAIPYFGMRSPQRISRALKDARQRLDLAQADVAAAAGISREALARIEGGRSMPRSETLIAILRALGLELVFWPRAMTDIDAIAPEPPRE